MHLVGIDGMPRRVADYADKYATLNAIISVSSFIFGLSFLDLRLQHRRQLAARRRRPPANPWRAHTLEWQVSSPPPIFNFDEVPTVVGGPYEYGVPGAVHGGVQGTQARSRGRRGAAPTGGAGMSDAD